jgi:hypothetical protein
MQIHWVFEPRVSCFHVADAVRRKLPLIDRDIADALHDTLHDLNQTLTGFVPPARFWESLIPCSIGNNDLYVVVTAAIKAVGGADVVSPSQIHSIAMDLLALESAVLAYWPRLPQDVRLRERPIREQWESRGPGLLRQFVKLTNSTLASVDAIVALVHPCLGGGGAVYPAYHVALFEAVLAHPCPAIPETVRLGWLLAQLGVNHEGLDASTSPIRRNLVLSLASSYIVLEAAEYVEWAQCNSKTLMQMFSTWRLPRPETLDATQTVEVLSAWREDCRNRSLPWAEALAQLDQLLP